MIIKIKIIGDTSALYQKNVAHFITSFRTKHKSSDHIEKIKEIMVTFTIYHFA